jgi:hypothetical protein
MLRVLAIGCVAALLATPARADGERPAFVCVDVHENGEVGRAVERSVFAHLGPVAMEVRRSGEIGIACDLARSHVEVAGSVELWNVRVTVPGGDCAYERNIEREGSLAAQSEEVGNVAASLVDVVKDGCPGGTAEEASVPEPPAPVEEATMQVRSAPRVEVAGADDVSVSGAVTRKPALRPDLGLSVGYRGGARFGAGRWQHALALRLSWKPVEVAWLAAGYDVVGTARPRRDLEVQHHPISLGAGYRHAFGKRFDLRLGGRVVGDVARARAELPSGRIVEQTVFLPLVGPSLAVGVDFAKRLHLGLHADLDVSLRRARGREGGVAPVTLWTGISFGVDLGPRKRK